MDRDPRNFWSPRRSRKVPRISPPSTLQDSERCLRLENLLPGIPNELTLKEISTKLSWKDFHVLSSVSRGWRHAIQSREVYNARVRSQTRETLALIVYGSLPSQIALYSMRDGSSYLLPPIPGFEGGIPSNSRCVSLDGKIYILGGLRDSSNIHDREVHVLDFILGGLRDSSNIHDLEVHVLDLAGQIGWKLCASMREGQSELIGGVHDGKIYGFWGNGINDHACGEVYDPKTNTWSRIRAEVWVSDHEVESLGEEIFVFNDPRDYDSRSTRNHFAYHPVKDEWREVNLSKFSVEDIPFVAQGNWHLLGTDGIYVHDADHNSWTELHTCSLPENINSVIRSPFGVQAVDKELLALWNCLSDFDGFCLFQSKGFCGDTREILWERVPLDFAAEWLKSNPCSMSRVQL
ncbi:unnamed protein product [Calypogeia fissa]